MSSTLNQYLTMGFHFVKDKLGLPVNYTSIEFNRFKRKLDWSRIEENRIRLLASMFEVAPGEVSKLVQEAESLEMEEKDKGNSEDFLGVGSPMGRTDRITLYALVRLHKPKVLIETGTAAGASSLYILTALEKNGEGTLHSIDAASDQQNVGRLIPEELKSRVQLHEGFSTKVLPDLLKKTGPIDFFFHDSHHTYENMMAEYQLARDHFGERGVLCSHDVLMTNAWKHFTRREQVKKLGTVKNFGFCLWEA